MEKYGNQGQKIVFSKTIGRWDEAIPLGNGICGALIWGPAGELRFSLDRGDIWDTTPYSGIFEEEFSYPNMVKLAREGNIEEIRRIFDAPYNQPLPSKLPAGKLIFDFGCEENVRSELDLRRAEAVLTIGDDIQIKSFLHADKQAGMIRVNRSLQDFSFRIENPEYGLAGEDMTEDACFDSLNTASLKQLRYPAPRISAEGNVRFFVQDIGRGFSYGVFAMAKESGGTTEIAYTIAASCDGAEWEKRAAELLEEALEQGYDALFAGHQAWWERYWSRSGISVPDGLFERNWYLAQYFLASCSRKGGYPMPLQGVWTADEGTLPPWKGDYHLDLNVQMSYSSYLKANHLEEGEALIDFLWELRGCAREFARSFYHSKGLCLPSTMTITGEPLGGWGMYSLSPTNQLWTCQLMERHYRYTGDRRFLEEKAYPYLEETAEFILGLLEERDGKYYLPISSTPEVHDDDLEAFVTPNSNYDLALMRYLFGALAKLSRELQDGKTEKWEQVLERLPELSVNEKGVLMLSPDESLEESHRHFSHAMAVYPLRTMDYRGKENRRIIDATVLDLERLGTGYWVGFSFTWMAQLYAVQRNGNGAAQQLEIFWRNCCSPNGFHLNGDYRRRGTSTFHYRPFTLEANFCAADALQEMLLQSEDNVLHLFPAVPDEWLEERVAFRDLRGEKGLLVSAVMERGTVVSLTLKPGQTGTVTLVLDGKVSSLAAQMEEHTDREKGRLELALCAGKEYVWRENA